MTTLSVDHQETDRKVLLVRDRRRPIIVGRRQERRPVQPRRQDHRAHAIPCLGESGGDRVVLVEEGDEHVRAEVYVGRVWLVSTAVRCAQKGVRSRLWVGGDEEA